MQGRIYPLAEHTALIFNVCTGEVNSVESVNLLSNVYN